MFLADPQAANTQWNEVEQEIRTLIERAGGKIRHLRKWDERRLAYPIRDRARGVYVLAYFDAPPSAPAEIRRVLVHSERILRALVLVHDERVPKDLRRALEPPRAPEEPAPAAEPQAEAS
jgi:ribosomal protein S6